MSNSRLWIAALFLSLLCACAADAVTAEVSLMDASMVNVSLPNYTLVNPEIKDLITTASAKGSLEFPVRTSLSFEKSGRLEKLYVSDGTAVKAGDPLAELSYDQEEVLMNIDITNIEIEQEKRNFEADEADYQKNVSVLTASRDRELDLRLKDILDMRIERAERSRQKAAAEHEAALTALNETLTGYEAMTAPAQMLAPSDGFIFMAARKSEGDMLEAEEVLMEICDTTDFYISFSGDAGSFCMNMPITAELGGDVFNGVIVSSPPAASSDGGREFLVKMYDAVPNIAGALNQEFQITGQQREITGALTIPQRALENEDGKHFVNILEDGVVKKRYIVIGASGSEDVQILDGLNESDQVILN
ncbi:MAG: biotin/lipoyl-binding protein [Clostridiales bacterium]|jgi:macrolide-specific efflux system membrane fusion protein|nr:biotin/lipoyl-binding protein [Clostridiales bacterium]